MSLKYSPLSELQFSDGVLNARLLESLQLFSKYYAEYYGKDYKDVSFAVTDKDNTIGYVLCAVLKGELTTPDSAINIMLFGEAEKDKKIYAQLLKHLTLVAKEHACASMMIKDTLEHGALSTLGELLFNSRFESRLTFQMERRFSSFTEENFHASLRKSYKSLISWGKKELTIEYINQEQLDSEKFKAFQKFHHTISGRKTRSQETWDAQYRMLEKGIAELIMGTYNGNLVAGTLCADYGDVSIYCTGVYERTLFDFGLSHFLLYQSILRSYERGHTSKFSLDYFDTDIKDPKWYNIQFYKKGICKSLTPVIFWSRRTTYGSTC
jgi:hypothetical protein